MTGRGQANALTRATAILAALFFATSMTLAVMSHRGRGAALDPRGRRHADSRRRQPNADNLLDTLRRRPGRPAAPAPAAPAQPRLRRRAGPAVDARRAAVALTTRRAATGIAPPLRPSR